MTALLRNHGVRDLFAISISRFSLRCSSTSSATPAKSHFLVSYLVESLGFSEEDAINALKGVSCNRSRENPVSAINVFRQIGLDDTQVRNIVSSVPGLLSCNVDKTLKPKLEFLIELGLSGSDLANVIARNKSFFRRRLNTHVIPSINYLKELLGSTADVVSIMKKSEWWLTSNVLKVVPPNVLLLEKCGLSKEKINKFIIQNPRYITMKPEVFEEIVHRVENEFGIPRDSGMFFNGFYVISSLSKSTLEMKLGVFRSHGWSDSDILTIKRALPFAFKLSEAKLEKGLNFFMKELGYSSEYLASRPILLTYSLEKRVLPRLLVLNILKEKKIIKAKISLYFFLNLSEMEFRGRYIFRYKEEIPDLHDKYVAKMGQ